MRHRTPVIDADGHVHHLDLVTADVTELGTLPGAQEVHTDGRFLYAGTPAGVVLQPTGVGLPLHTRLTLTLRLGNSSGVRKRTVPIFEPAAHVAGAPLP